MLTNIVKTLNRMISGVPSSSKKETLRQRLHDIEVEALIRASYDPYPWYIWDEIIPELERLRDEIRAAV